MDSIDAYYAIPTLSQLEAYRVVILAPNSRYADSEAFGNVLADYVDGGGGVIVTLAAFVGGWEVRGRFLYEGYSPFEIGSGPIGASALAWYDSSHPIMQGVTFATGDLLAATRLTAGAVPVADWAFGQPFVATRGERVVGVNVFVGTAGYWTGDVPLILHNAAFWAGGGTRWLTAEPTTGTIAAGQTEDVTVTFDAVDMDGGLYDAELRVSYPELGYGFLEKVYENALVIALKALGLNVQQQVKITVYFQNQIVGEYFSDLVVDGVVIVELKAVSRLLAEHESQLLNYLRATPYEVGLLLNFGPKPQFIRKAFDNSRKTMTWIQ